MTDLITEARELIEALHAGEYDDEYIGTGAYLMLDELCDALEKAETRGKGCEHCRGWDKRCGANYCPMCGKALPIYAGTIGGEIVKKAMREAEE